MVDGAATETDGATDPLSGDGLVVDPSDSIGTMGYLAADGLVGVCDPADEHAVAEADSVARAMPFVSAAHRAAPHTVVHALLRGLGMTATGAVAGVKLFTCLVLSTKWVSVEAGSRRRIAGLQGQERRERRERSVPDPTHPVRPAHSGEDAH